jgi:hypothetical protein
MPLYQRPLDLLLFCFYCVSVTYGLLFSLPQATGMMVDPESPWPPMRWLYDWAVAQEPQHLDPPLTLMASVTIDGFVHSPFLLFLLYALWTRGNWIRPWALLFAGSAVTNMFFYFYETFGGAHPPPNTAYYLAFNLPWLIAPILLAWRMLPERPFEARPRSI